MRILLLGEYSNVHHTLAKGLRNRGHEVLLVSNGDFWKNYPRDIDVARPEGRWGGLRLLVRIISLLPRLRGFDIVQIINPLFFELGAQRIRPIYEYLRRNNRHIVLGAFGMDHYWVKTCCDEKPLRYSDFNIGNTLRQNADARKERHDWLGTPKAALNQMIAEDADCIVAGLYEYFVCYERHFPTKTRFIPFPIEVKDHAPRQRKADEPVRIFIGISRGRSEYKGTDIMLRAAQQLKTEYGERIDLRVAEGVPFAKYVEMMNGADLILDQLYSYTPSMNPLEAMSRGIICVGGGEPENYAILNETELHPIINVQPTYESCYDQLRHVVENPTIISQLQRDSILYVRRHHDHNKVAEAYEKMYQSLDFNIS